MRLFIFLALIIAAIYSPVVIQAEEDEQESIIVEVEGDPEEHKEYLEIHHPFIDVVATYDILFNGLALQGNPRDLEKMESLEFIKAVHDVQTYEALPYKISEVPKKEDVVLPSQLNNTSYTGEGVKVAVIDTGIDHNHPDLEANYKQGYDLVDLDDDPMETVESQGMATLHGSHVSGIIAANGELQGVAPEADIYAYRALGPGGAGTSVQVIAAMEQAVKDEVDVMNLSLGNSVNGPDYPTSVAVNRAVELGIPVVIANGNSGPNNWTVGAPATATDALSVGASTNPMEIPYLQLAFDETIIPLQLMMGSVPWHLNRDYKVVDAVQESSLHGKIALIQRGETPFYELAKAAEEKGAEAVLIYNNEEDMMQGSIDNGQESIGIPVAFITKQEGEMLLEKIGQKSLYAETNYHEADTTIAPFSSRGPVTVNWDIKPDVLAPGTNIMSTVPGGYQALQGTSMAAPHVAGVIALIKEAHPDWTTRQIYGAIETTAQPLMTEEGGLLPPNEQGMGVIQPEEAIETNTIIHNPKVTFGKIETFHQTKDFEIKIENTSDKAQTYSFEIPKKQQGLVWHVPKTFTLEGKETKNLKIELSITSPLLEEGMHQGWLTLRQEDTSFQLPYLFINQATDNPKAMGFGFSLKAFSDDEYMYQLYVTDPTKRIEVELYDAQTLLFERTLLEIENLKIGMNEGEMEKSEIGKPGSYHAVITVYLEDGRKESYESPLFIE
ncbi:S8 family serine peptidase [Oceanobacillus bengalensis]|uniref:Peptidase S8 n=1 Tax=Oceanobacillus bengalensis TaxID=1435466 RepID=A0A494YYU1_9BACI|nr:S8 family serine peptidase [Oceanobacillus bengalensis]RKQ15365.1 peptidase S8 [Oceanobacillus bengalensis]